MLVGAVQMNSGGDKDKNIQKAGDFITEAAERGASLVALPEMFSSMASHEVTIRQAEPVPGPTSDRMAELASQLGVFILCGSIPEKSDTDGKVFNTSLLIDPAGKITATYRKIHLMEADIRGGPHIRESDSFLPGSEVVAVSTELGICGLTICYDLRFPELYRKLVSLKAQVIFIPSAFTRYTGKDHWEPLIRARAIENLVYIVAPNQFGSHPPGRYTYGKSMIVDPWGIVMAKASDREMVVYADLDLGYLSQVREQFPNLRNRRDDIFKN